MLNSTLTKSDVLKAADLVRLVSLFDPTTEQFIHDIEGMPVEKWVYHEVAEPVIDVDGFNSIDGSAWLTLNHYDSIILGSRNMLIADVDRIDNRSDSYGCTTCVHDVIKTLLNIRRLDEAFPDDAQRIRFSEQSYRVYETHSGWRVICTSVPYAAPSWYSPSLEIMDFLRSDANYMEHCVDQGCFRARLTPKPYRCDGGESHVCNLIATIGNGDIHPDLQDQLQLHDEMTLRKFSFSLLA